MTSRLELLRSYYRAFKYSARICKILLVDHKYFASVRSGELLDKEGNYIPWFSFCAVEAIKNWDLSDRRVFEYGSGYSTLFWAARAKEVISVEHNPGWHEKIAKIAPSNAHIVLAPIVRKSGERHSTPETLRRYAEVIQNFGTFDLIVLDGYAGSRLRYQSAQAALPQLAASGLIILDNSDWLPATAMYLRRAGLIEVDLSGPAPQNDFCQTTSFFFARQFDFRSADKRQPRPPVGAHVANWEAALERELLNEGASSETSAV
jgi:hypothetical protein